jgi:hypothetical protein
MASAESLRRTLKRYYGGQFDPSETRRVLSSKARDGRVYRAERAPW